MSNLIERYKISQYITYDNIRKYPDGFFNIIQGNSALKQKIEQFYTIVHQDERLNFYGNGSSLTDAIQISFIGGNTSSGNIVNVQLLFKEESIFNEEFLRGNPDLSEQINFIFPKKGGIGFWGNEKDFFFGTTQVKDTTTDTTTTELLFINNNNNYIKSSVRVKDKETQVYTRSIQQIVPCTEEIITSSSNSNRMDYRGFNLGKGKTDYVIYPYYQNQMEFLDLYYYDSGNAILGDKEILFLDDRAFLCINSKSNLLLELNTEEEE